MKRATSLLATLALFAASCSGRPTAPTAASPAPGPDVSSAEGTVSTTAVTVERIRLRRAGGPDIMTSLVTGQLIDVPLNVNLDVWAEVRRLATDAARLVVDWGDGTTDFTGCGSCRLEHKYTESGRYAVTAKVVDLTAPGGAPPVLFAAVTLNVFDSTPFVCPSFVTSFVGNLDGVSNDSTFEQGAAAPLPAQGWVNVTNSAQVFDLATPYNGALVGTTPYGNYQVQYDTGIAIQPDRTYTLHFDMGYLAGLTSGNSGFSFELGTLNGSVFTPLGVPVTGNAPYAGSLGANFVSAAAQQTVTTGATVSGDRLAVRWQQTSSLAGGTSDFFGFGTVTLAVTRCAVVP